MAIAALVEIEVHGMGRFPSSEIFHPSSPTNHPNYSRNKSIYPTLRNNP